MEKVYIAGAYRAKTKLGIIRNILKARRAGIMLASRGYNVFVPHLNFCLFDGVQPDWYWLECGKEWLRDCDIVFMMNGWMNSKGAVEEYKLAKELKKRVVFEEDDSLRWITAFAKGIREADLLGG